MASAVGESLADTAELLPLVETPFPKWSLQRVDAFAFSQNILLVKVFSRRLLNVFTE
jgi:hypothetical protein